MYMYYVLASVWLKCVCVFFFGGGAIAQRRDVDWHTRSTKFVFRYDADTLLKKRNSFPISDAGLRMRHSTPPHTHM